MSLRLTPSLTSYLGLGVLEILISVWSCRPLVKPMYTPDVLPGKVAMLDITKNDSFVHAVIEDRERDSDNRCA